MKILPAKLFIVLDYQTEEQVEYKSKEKDDQVENHVAPAEICIVNSFPRIEK